MTSPKLMGPEKNDNGASQLLVEQESEDDDDQDGQGAGLGKLPCRAAPRGDQVDGCKSHASPATAGYRDDDEQQPRIFPERLDVERPAQLGQGRVVRPQQVGQPEARRKKSGIQQARKLHSDLALTSQHEQSVSNGRASRVQANNV